MIEYETRRENQSENTIEAFETTETKTVKTLTKYRSKKHAMITVKETRFAVSNGHHNFL